MVEVKNLTKFYGSIKAVDDISFTVETGEVLGFLGPNGAGKSTTMNMITGYLSSTSGTVTIDGCEILDDPIHAKSKIGYLPEIPPLYIDMTVKKYLEFMFDLKKVKLPKKEHIDEVMRLTKITEQADRIIKHLSKGYRQRVGLALGNIVNHNGNIVTARNIRIHKIQAVLRCFVIPLYMRSNRCIGTAE